MQARAALRHRCVPRGHPASQTSRGKEGCCVVVEAGLAGRSGAQKQAIMAEPGQMEGKNVRTLKRDVGCHNGCTSDQDRAKPGRAHAFQKSLA